MQDATVTLQFLRFSAGSALAIVVSANCLICSDAVAENATLLLAGGATAFEETYLDAPPPSSRGALLGVSIVGVRLDGPAREFNPNAVRAMLGDGDNARPFLCVRFISRDGRYSARARYKLAAGTDPTPLLEIRTEYGQQLSGYSFSDIAIVASSAKTCENPKDGSFFAVAPGAAVNSQLVVLISGDARVQAQLRQSNKPIVPPVVCSPVAGVRIGFTQECRFDLPPTAASGVYQLSVGETATSGEISVKTHSLVLYRAAQTK